MSSEFFSSLMNRLFPQVPEDPPGATFVTEPLIRGSKYAGEYCAWRMSERLDASMNMLVQHEQAAILKGLENVGFQLYKSPQSNGFYFNSALGFSAMEFRFLLDHFYEVTLAMGYQKYTAERRYSERPNGVHCLERYYLKPELVKVFEPPIDQRYGNVHLELVLLNEVPSYLKVMAHVYSDRNYSTPLPFEEFTNKLFEIS